MRLLRNSLQGINLTQKHLLYRYCILPIALYGFQLWFYNKALLSYPIKVLRKMQRRAAIWILEAFKTLPTDGLEAITGLIPIKFHLQKLASRSRLHAAALPENHLIRTLMDDPLNSCIKPSSHSINTLTECQKSITKGHLINSNNKLFGIFLFFSSLNLELILGSRIVDVFSDRFLFNVANKEKMINCAFNNLMI